jgi:NAD(P)-dependent dehydrogenase (short-subunit alcohol dehydrogenase family)
MMFSLARKFALVTGAGSGIGASIAETFARAGARVFVTDLNTAGGSATVGRIVAAGGRAEFFALDIADEAQCAEVARAVLSAAGQLDVLVNNAGIGHVGTMVNTTAADLDRLHAVNTRGTFNVIKAFFPSMLARRSGSIVNIASIGGVLGVRDRLAYTMTKHAVVGLTRAMALDHARDGIRINAICPGRVETPWVAERLKESPDPEKAYAQMCSTQPMGRMGRPEEIAAAALYLASDEAAFVTGVAFTPDGGWSAG